MLCAPFVFALGSVNAWSLAVAVYVLGLITDALDGRIARATQSTTSFGRAMDSAADKALVVGAMLALVMRSKLSVWLVFLFVLREFAVFGLRAIRTVDGTTVAEISDRLGRVRFFVLHVGLVALLAPISGPWHMVGTAAVITSTVLAYTSVAYYVNRDRVSLYATMRRVAK